MVLKMTQVKTERVFPTGDFPEIAGTQSLIEQGMSFLREPLVWFNFHEYGDINNTIEQETHW